ncbi:hypothetical protein EVAR_77109_1 [Eumeta japonica]|uniref:Uncharacterized protein n=1 Tax=Eumeta variegata TaxID=151549 RepID=A0A4C1T562_EUMVA|nr:hypothetical protein EVAR_77109_1 [Eumeta japonica]
MKRNTIEQVQEFSDEARSWLRQQAMVNIIFNLTFMQRLKSVWYVAVELSTRLREHGHYRARRASVPWVKRAPRLCRAGGAALAAARLQYVRRDRQTKP